MPRGDGTGPLGQGAGTGRGLGRGTGGGLGRNRGNKAGAGPSGNCVCPDCGAKAVHEVGTPCYSVKCPKCNSFMVRE